MAVSNRVKLVIINNPNTSAKRLSKLAYVDISQIHRGLRELNIPQHSETRISRLLDVYYVNTERYLDDIETTKLMGYKRERRSVVSQIRARLMELDTRVVGNSIRFAINKGHADITRERHEGHQFKYFVNSRGY